MWAVAGLELIAGAVASGSKEALVNRLRVDGLNASEQQGASEIIRELLWPKDSEGKRRDDRSAVFRFAVMCIVLSPETMHTDLPTLKRLWRERSEIAHGSARSDADLSTGVAIGLFRYFGNRYLMQRWWGVATNWPAGYMFRYTFWCRFRYATACG